MDKEQRLRYKRFKEAFDYLKSIGRIDNQKDLADILHKTPETISRVMAGSGNNPTEKFMFFFAKAFAHDLNEEYLVEGTGELIRVIPENEQYKLGDQRYIENLEAELREAKAKINLQFQLIESLKRQIEMLEEKSKDADVWKQVVSNYHQHFDQENKKDKVSVG